MDSSVIELSGNEWRLGHVALLNAMVLVSAWRFIRRRASGDWLAAIPQVMLCWFLVQYLSVMVPGLAGILNRWTMSATAAGICLVLWALSLRVESHGLIKQATTKTPVADRYVLWACIFFLVGYLAGVIHNQRLFPPLSDDALTYHLPAAARWLQTGRLVLHETWFFNPANTYSPLAASALAAWWIAPMGHDYLARFLQVPALVLIFFALLQLCRELGAPLAVASLLALSAALSRPFISQILLAKDDLLLSGAFITAVVSLSPTAMRDSLGPWRLAVTVGLFLATKVTALLALPILLLMVDAPYRAGWRWRQWSIAVAFAALLAGPWYVRNWNLTGNPLYPTRISVLGVTLFPGLFSAERSLELRSVGGLWHVIAQSYFQMPPSLLVVLMVATAAAAIIAGRRLVGAPVVRVCVLGPFVGLAAFVLAAPFPEVRFLDPSFLLLMAAPAVLAAAAASYRALSLAAAALLAALSISTGFLPAEIATLTGIGLLFAAAAFLVAYAHHVLPRVVNRALVVLGTCVALIVAASVYVYQNALIRDYAQTVPMVWEAQYGPLGAAWAFLRSNIPPGKTVAYANTYFVYPLFGFDLGRNVVYAPTRSGIMKLSDLPPTNRSIPGEGLRAAAVLAAVANADRGTWLANLDRLGADYLFIAKDDAIASPPELRFIAEVPAMFSLIYQNESAAIYRINRPPR